jgi:hypothetical protein
VAVRYLFEIERMSNNLVVGGWAMKKISVDFVGVQSQVGLGR